MRSKGSIRFESASTGASVEVHYQERSAQDAILEVEIDSQKIDARALAAIAGLLEKEEQRLLRGRRLYS
ncbi:MAG: hypothetical protein QF590_05755, partial [Dehalococcoidia bacterium]|nr:hypothetical protein [Dehalococcoidia bacterium]